MADVHCSKNFLINKLKQNKTRQQFKILIVDDDEITAEIFGDILKQRGHNITIATESATCINKCQNYQYDIIFMDFHMDCINGVDMTDLLKNSCHTTSIIFAVTGDDSRDALEQFKNIGMDGALIKPLDIDLINKLMNSLEMRNSVDKRVIKTMTTPFKKHLIIFD